MLVYRPGLLLGGGLPQIVYDLVLTAIAIVAICAAMIGYLAGRIGLVARLVLFGAGVLFFVPGATSDVAAALLLASVVAWQLRGARRAVPADSSPVERRKP